MKRRGKTNNLTLLRSKLNVNPKVNRSPVDLREESPVYSSDRGSLGRKKRAQTWAEREKARESNLSKYHASYEGECIRKKRDSQADD